MFRDKPIYEEVASACGPNSMLGTEFYSERIQFASPNGLVAVMPQGIGIDWILYHFIFLTQEGKGRLKNQFIVSDLEGREVLPFFPYPQVLSFFPPKCHTS